MKVRTTDGMILESNNELVIEQWKKKGYSAYKEKKMSEKQKETTEDDISEKDTESEQA